VLAVLLALLLIGGGGAVGVLVLGLGAAYQTASDATVVEEVEPADVVTPEPAPEPEPARVEPPAPVDEPVDNDEPAEVPSDDEPVDAPTPVPRPVPAPAAPTPRPAPQPVAEQPASTGGEVRCAQCDGIASFWLSDRMGNRVDAEALTPGTYVMWVRLPEDPASHRTSEVSLTRPGEKVDVRCNAAMVTCSRL
jgi:hypothetical protein